MAARSIASLSLSFGLVSIPVRLFSATESASGVRFNLLDKDGSRLRQQYVNEHTGAVVERAQMVKGYEFEKGRFVIFAPDELKALEEGSRQTIDIVAFIPDQAIDPLFYDKAYLVAPDKRGGKPYALLQRALLSSGRCALARWAWKGKQYVVQVRATDDGMVVRQLLYADELRTLKALDIEHAAVSDAELKLALQLVEQNTRDGYDPREFRDEEKGRVLAAIDRKIAGREVVQSERGEDAPHTAEVVDLMEALRKSLGGAGGDSRPAKAAAPATRTAATRKTPRRTPGPPAAPAPAAVVSLGERKPARRGGSEAPAVAPPAPARRARR